jgi:arylsulfatase A-like enzyme
MDAPFFLAAGFLKPHLPFNAPEKYWKPYDGKVRLPENNHPPENAPKESIHNFGELRAYAGIPETGPVSDEMAFDLIQGYYACVSYTDAQIGKILDELERLELDKSTIVLLWGDQGWNLREHGLWCKHCNYETSLNTPLILRVPGVKQVGSSVEIVEFVDIYPTLCELAGLELPEHLQGDSFRDLLFDTNATSDGVAVCQWYKGITTIKKNYFYTEWVDDADNPFARMLYDHNVDPGENFNISEQEENAGIIKQMSEEMRQSRAENYFQ